MLKRLLGLIMILIGLSGIAVGWLGGRNAEDVVDAIGITIETNLDLLSQSLDALEDTLILAKVSITDVTTGMDTVQTAADDIATDSEGGVQVAINGLDPLARLGGNDYSELGRSFTVDRPK